MQAVSIPPNSVMPVHPKQSITHAEKPSYVQNKNIDGNDDDATAAEQTSKKMKTKMSSKYCLRCACVFAFDFLY